MVEPQFDEDVLDYLNRFWQQNHYPPTRRQITEGCGIGSTNTVQRALDRLSRQKVIKLAGESRVPVPSWVSVVLEGAGYF